MQTSQACFFPNAVIANLTRRLVAPQKEMPVLHAPRHDASQVHGANDSRITVKWLCWTRGR